MVWIDIKVVRSAVFSSSAVNVTTDAGVPEQEIEGFISSRIQLVHTSVHRASATSPKHHGADHQTDSHAGAESAEIVDLEAKSSNGNAADNGVKVNTLSEDAG